MALGPSLSVQSQENGDCQSACGLPRSVANVTLSIGYWLTPRVGLAAEVTVGDLLRGRQQIHVPGGHLESQTTHQDIIVAGTAQWTLRPIDSPINGVLVGGLGIALRQTHRTGPFRVVDGTVDGGWPGNVVSDLMPSIVGGFELPYRVYRRRVWLVPSVRLHYLFDDDATSEYPKRGVDNVLVDLGAKVAVRF